MFNIKELTIENATKEMFSGKELYQALYSEPSQIAQAEYICHLRNIAKALGAKENFETMNRAYAKLAKENALVSDPSEYRTEFTCDDYPTLRTGKWIVDDDGIQIIDKGGNQILVSHEPVTIAKKSRCIQTGNEKVTLAYRTENGWREKTVPRSTICKSGKLQDLSDCGFPVTSSNAAKLVNYLGDLEHLNKESIQVEKATEKIGWIGNEFIPYTEGYVFDTDSIGLQQLYDSIHEKGKGELWLKFIRNLRANCADTLNVMLAASFSSVLVEKLNALSFLVNLYGTTGYGKSVALKVVTSIWAEPGKSYIGDFDGTDIGTEVRADFLNNLPVVLDDSSKISQTNIKKFEMTVYQLASGKGRSRSNVKLGIDRERTWNLCTLTTGERPLTSLCNQGGAEARTLELQLTNKLFQRPRDVSHFVDENYGFAGKWFVEVIQELGEDKLKAICKEEEQKILEMIPNAMGKQVASMAVVLTADKIMTDYIFQDGKYISMDTVAEIIKTEDEVSDYEKMYNDLMDFIRMNPGRFDGSGAGMQYGFGMDGEYVKFYELGFRKACELLGYKKPNDFLQWGIANEKILADKGRRNKNTKLSQANAERYAQDNDVEVKKQIRCIWFKIEKELQREAEERLPEEKLAA